MRTPVRNNAFARCVRERYDPDDYEPCAVCGEPVRWPCEQAAWDENNQLCHAECAEEERV